MIILLLRVARVANEDLNDIIIDDTTIITKIAEVTFHVREAHIDQSADHVHLLLGHPQMSKLCIMRIILLNSLGILLRLSFRLLRLRGNMNRFKLGLRLRLRLRLGLGLGLSLRMRRTCEARAAVEWMRPHATMRTKARTKVAPAAKCWDTHGIEHVSWVMERTSFTDAILAEIIIITLSTLVAHTTNVMLSTTITNDMVMHNIGRQGVNNMRVNTRALVRF